MSHASLRSVYLHSIKELTWLHFTETWLSQASHVMSSHILKYPAEPGSSTFLAVLSQTDVLTLFLLVLSWSYWTELVWEGRQTAELSDGGGELPCCLRTCCAFICQSIFRVYSNTDRTAGVTVCFIHDVCVCVCVDQTAKLDVMFCVLKIGKTSCWITVSFFFFVLIKNECLHHAGDDS